MTEENFFARWSRRKREAEPKAHGPAALPQELPAKPRPSEGTPSPAATAEKLPPLEAIDPSTDIRGFLAEGVPAALSRAALRRAWASDPAIRDFIGLAENAWDFNAPDGVAGFGPLGADEIRRLLAAADDAPAALATKAETAPAATEPAPPQPAADPFSGESGEPSPGVAEAAVAPDVQQAPSPPRRHGRALPQ
jgi:hypothetical protein